MIQAQHNHNAFFNASLHDIVNFILRDISNILLCAITNVFTNIFASFSNIVFNFIVNATHNMRLLRHLNLVRCLNLGRH